MVGLYSHSLLQKGGRPQPMRGLGNTFSANLPLKAGFCKKTGFFLPEKVVFIAGMY